jgi:hypothetical protein
MPLCFYGGFCTRALGHLGAHTASPLPGTPAFDEAKEPAAALAGLDFETPEWADLLDDPS